MRVGKKWILVTLAVVVLLGSAFILSSPRQQMRNYVLNHKSELDAFASACQEQHIPYSGSYDGHTVDQWDTQPKVLLLHWSTFGLAPSGKYYVLLYSADGTPRPYPGMESYDELVQMFGWRWLQSDGDNGCYVENIDGNWYYCEAWF